MIDGDLHVIRGTRFNFAHQGKNTITTPFTTTPPPKTLCFFRSAHYQIHAMLGPASPSPFSLIWTQPMNRDYNAAGWSGGGGRGGGGRRNIFT